LLPPVSRIFRHPAFAANLKSTGWKAKYLDKEMVIPEEGETPI